MIHYKKDTDNIATLTLDMAGVSANIINHRIWEAFVPVLDHLKQEKKRGQLRGVILTSAKKTFLSGGALDYLYQARDASEIFESAERLKQFLRDLEHPGVPVVAAINGSAIGVGFEVALACHRRIALRDDRLRLGLPEAEMGLIPGGGGIIRLMWLLGVAKAYEILADGRRYLPHEALQKGIIDDLADSPKEMLLKAKSWLLETSEGRRPWDRPGATIPGGTAHDLVIAQHLREQSARLAAQTHFIYPAQRAILQVLSEGSKVDFNTACRIESRYYTELVLSRECKNMIKAFWFDANFIRTGKNRPRGFGKFRPRQVGIIGAGLMGSGIALSCLRQGMKVVLKDVSKPIADRGREWVTQKINALVENAELQASQAEKMRKNIQTTDDSSAFETCDLVIEAVFENQAVKQKVTREAEQYLDEYALFGTNTISIPITKLAAASIRPAHYVGLHFFHPAEEVPLVEIVRGALTSDETIARAFDFVQAIQKTPIIVKDDWGFFAARVQNTYILEGITLLQEGYPPALIENLGRQAGMPKGALELADDLGLDLVLHYEQQAAEHYGPKYIQHPAVQALTKMLTTLERPGRAKRAGFYQYDSAGQRTLWPELTAHFPSQNIRANDQEVTDRLLFAQVIEAVWCMQEEVIFSIAAANLGSIYGWGFPAAKGGVIQYIRDYGLAKFQHRCNHFQQAYGQRFRAPKLLPKVATEPEASI
ncbi:MAG: enoyl-CoA hydratase/isomerase family protein [Lewinellaceae bacterium]|nr:enoyl-CoA hydratase/isomerase family protein [Lewinellaceae bacterium]